MEPQEFGPLPTPMDLAPGDFSLVEGVMVGALFMPNVGPAIAIRSVTNGVLGKAMVLPLADAEHRERVAKLFELALGALENEELMRSSEARAISNTDQAAAARRSTVTTCPGCSRPIFGDVAARGACLDCFPKID